MPTQELIDALNANHNAFAAYIATLPEANITISANGKWSAAQHFAHVCLCLDPIAQALRSKQFIQDKFGVLSRPVLSYNQVIDTYKKGLAAGGKAPERFVPGDIAATDIPQYNDSLAAALGSISASLGGYTDHELDTLILPHPFLGPLAIRELLYVMAYHPTHHQEQVVRAMVL